MDRVIVWVGLIIVLTAATYLVVLGGSALFRPALARQFLRGFATTQTLHFLELALRIVAGGAFIMSAPRLALGDAVAALGWVLVGTSLVLALIPWRLHQRFAAWSVPQALQYLPLIGVVALAGGLGLIAAVVLPRVAA
ncbi:MAG: hypothetical protein K2Y26_07425 [Gemmatimonadaceae bacterium]|nr:hypothetical protein [Gemmatimonadaceae bacterium]